MVLWSENCVQVKERQNMILCNSKQNGKHHSLLRLSSQLDKETNQMEFKTTYLGSIVLDFEKQIDDVFCQYTMGKREDAHCKGLFLVLNDMSSVYVQIPSIGMVKHIIPKNGALDLSEIEKLAEEREYKLSPEYTIQNDLVFTVESLFFQKLEFDHLNQWKDYDQIRQKEGVLGTWRKRLSINYQSLKNYTSFVWDKVKKGEWSQILSSDSKHNDFLGFDQKMVVITQQFTIHLMNWEGLEVEKTVDIFKVLDISMSPDFKGFWGSSKEQVMSWLPISMYLSKEIPEGKQPPDDLIAKFQDDTRIQYEEYGPKTLTKMKNNEHNVLLGCNIFKLDQSVENQSFFVICKLSSEFCPFIIFKMNAMTLNLEYMTIKELRESARKMDELILFSYFKNFGNRPALPIDLYKKGQEPQKDEIVNWVRVDNEFGQIYAISHSNDKIWSLDFGDNKKMIEIIRPKKKKGDFSQVNQVSGNLVLQRVIDSNVILILYYEKPTDLPEKDPKRQINLMTVDLQGGKILKTISLVSMEEENLNFMKKSLKTFIVDHTFYIMFKISYTSEYYVFSVAIFRRAIQQDIIKIIKDYFKGVNSLSPLDHLGEEAETIILDRKFLLPSDSRILGFSKTKNNVTQKSLFITSKRNQIWGIPQIMLSPQRMSQKQKDDKEKHIENGTLHYTKRDKELQYMMDNYPVYSQPEIKLHSGLSVSKDIPLTSVKFFASEGTFLESTSLVLTGGIDWFAFRYSPDGLYDRVNPDFKKNLLILGVFGIALLLFASKFYENVGIDKKRYLSQEK